MSNLVYFKMDEFGCKCGHCDSSSTMSPLFLSKLDELRARCGFPFAITSGFRCSLHPKEAIKATPGTHNQGIAADFQIHGGVQRRRVIDEALEMGFGGIGVAKTFMHVDDRDTTPVIWTYGPWS